MPKLKMAVPHSLTQDEAIKRIKVLLDDTKKEFAHKISALHEEWDGNTGRFNFSAMGFSVSGTLTVKTSQVDISGNFPLAAMLFKRKIESTIRHCAETLLA
ncbi:polyhydroxyalkanoic acid system family protein [Geobacter sp. SVR]|uniref:polyhydroxyalkanoic acid system family protein n=1 Tax=Geobacter sp. SVR TaxID=2495594 RepID=UPI00143EFEB9|nr:polyhydroxyalkanoic acid system family protein [Geobacter sp. SVR]BCS54423.1 hypothetical protein GSVR_27310 [Geobacter sp. SVR]GCF87654.1 hypothetical protein GSbR_42540 [Geobacter sp. SVR]